MDSNNEQILASVTAYLIQGNETDREAAKLLLSCELELYGRDEAQAIAVVRGSRQFLDAMAMIYDPDGELPDTTSSIYDAIQEGFLAVAGDYPVRIIPKFHLVEVDTDWRSWFLAEMETEQVVNQNPYEKKPIVWNRMKFSSPPEVEIAKALERTGVMHFPNCLVRVGKPGNQQTRILDFLISYQGKWGVLEIDGKTYHTASTATQDHERRRIFEQHKGIAYFDRFPASRCSKEPDKVVREFLEILANK